MLRRAGPKLRARLAVRRLRSALVLDADAAPAETIGEPGYNAYAVVPSGLTEGAWCLSVGVGEDLSFDRALLHRFGVRVLAFDPVPRAAAHVDAQADLATDERFAFRPWAVWDQDTELTFHKPVVDGYVSQSAVDLHGTAPDFTAPARSVASLMREFGIERVALLKVSAEGAEYRIVRGVLDARAAVDTMCVEFSQPVDAERALALVETARGRGYRLATSALAPYGVHLTLTRLTRLRRSSPA